jgi:hypothetical protein
MQNDRRSRHEGCNASHRAGKIGMGMHDVKTTLTNETGQPEDICRVVVGPQTEDPQAPSFPEEEIGQFAAGGDAPYMGLIDAPIQTIADRLDDPLKAPDLEVLDQMKDFNWGHVP